MTAAIISGLLAELQLYILDNGRVVDQSTLIREELARAGASSATLDQQTTSDPAYRPTDDDFNEATAVARRSPFIDQYIKDTAQNPSGEIRYGPGFTTVDASGRYTFGVFAETAEQMIRRVGLQGGTPVTIGLPPTSVAATGGFMPPVGGGGGILAAPNLPAFVDGEFGALELRTDRITGQSEWGRIEFGRAGTEFPYVEAR